MSDEEFLRINIRLHELWPGHFDEQQLKEWVPAMRQLQLDAVLAAVNEHHRTVGFAPRLAEITQRIAREAARRAGAAAATRTSRYLAEQRAAGDAAAAELAAMRGRLGRLHPFRRAELLELALEKLDEQMPAMAAHFYRRREESPVVLAAMVALMDGRPVAEEVAA